MIVVVTVVRRNVDVPLAVNLVQLGCPVFRGIHGAFVSRVDLGAAFAGDLVEGFDFVHAHAVAAGVAVVVIVTVADDPRVGAASENGVLEGAVGIVGFSFVNFHKVTGKSQSRIGQLIRKDFRREFCQLGGIAHGAETFVDDRKD